MRKSILRDKSYSFAIAIVKFSYKIQQSNKEFVLSKQILRSGTAIGALIKEAEFAQSKKDFINKMNIALKEANETDYWLHLLKDTNFINKTQFDELNGICKELIAMLVSTIKTTKSNMNKN